MWVIGKGIEWQGRNSARPWQTSLLAATAPPAFGARWPTAGRRPCLVYAIPFGRRQSGVGSPAESADQSESWSESCADRAQPAPLAHHSTLLGTATHIMLLLLHPTLAASSDGPPALVAHSPCRASPALFGRDAVKARDALLGQCPLGQPRGVRRRGYSPGHRPRDAHSVETTPDV